MVVGNFSLLHFGKPFEQEIKGIEPTKMKKIQCAILKYLFIIIFFLLCVAVYHNLETPEARMTIQDDPLSYNWELTPDMERRILHRKQHAEKVCHKYGLDNPSPTNWQNTHEFLANIKHGLIWCNVFKAASSTWFWNFNLLAGYKEEELIQNIKSPMVMARKKYPRLNKEVLEQARLYHPSPITFMIARHPFHRLVSGFRDKIQSDDEGYQAMRWTIIKLYKEFDARSRQNWIIKFLKRKVKPSFPQFVQYIIDEHAAGRLKHSKMITAI